MTRLTNDIRSDIVEAMSAHAFEERIEATRIEHAAIAEAVYEAVFNVTERKRIDALPDGWLPRTNDVQAKFGSEIYRFSFDGNISRYSYNRFFSKDRKSISKYIPYSQQNTTLIVFDHDHVLTTRAVDYFRLIGILDESISTAERSATAALKKFSTTEKLIKEWPEAAPFISERDKPLPVPMVQTSALNDMFGLPVE